MCVGLYSNTINKSVKSTVNKSLYWLIFAGFFILPKSIVSQTTLGPVNMGNLTDYLFVFTDANAKANWQGATKGFVGNVAIDGIQANETTSGGVPFAGTIYTNDGSLGAWQDIVDQNAGQATGSTGQTTRLAQLESQLNSAFSQINALSPSAGYSSVSSTSLNGLNTQNGINETFVINITSGLGFSSQINITGDAGDVFILRWDSDGNPNNGYQGDVKPQSGGAIVPLGGLKPSNFINVAGNLDSSGGGSTPSAPYPQGPRLNNGTGALISGAQDFSGGGYFTGYWLTTGAPSDGKTSSLSNGIFVGGWYSKTTEFSMTSGTSGVYVAPGQNNCCGFGKGDEVKQLVLWYTGENCSASINSQGAIGGNWNCSGDPAFDTQVYIVVNDRNGTDLGGNVYFSGNINIDGTFTATSASNFNADTYVHIYNQQGGNQTQLLKIKTNCSSPVVLGDQFGSIIIVDAKFKNGYSCTPDIPCESFTPTITGAGNLCIDNVALTTLTATGGSTYLWNTGATTASISFTPMATTTYTVVVTSPGGCTKSVSKTVKVIDCTGEICFSGANNVSATANWVISYSIDPANDKVTIRATLSKNFVDNTYGTNAIGWPGGHTFGNLVGSDHLILSMLDGNNVKKMETKMDYISTSAGAPSGYDCLGVLGGEGDMILGNASDVLSVTTSLDQNFNTYGYVLTTNSPATNANYTPNATYPNWIYDVWYEIEVKLSVFGAAGFGKVGITGVHASPSKTGNNTEIVMEGPCPDPCDVFAPTITGTNSICNDNLVPTNLSVTGGVGTYLWSTGATTSSINVTPSPNGSTYTVTVTSVDSCVKVLTKTILVKPCSGQICFNGANGVSATTNWTITYTTDPINDKVKIRATLSKNFVDNTYGTNAIGWNGGHTFGNLVGSDHLILSMLDGNNVKRMETKLDYISTAPTASGYDALGVTGGEGSMILGSSSDVLSATTSLDQNFNTFGYVLTTNSPATDANYTPNPTYPNWIYDVWYEVEVRLSAFGSAGFGTVGITGVHASPSKTGNNTEEVTEGPCCELTPTITGDNLICAGESTQLTATYLSNTTLDIYPIDDNYLANKNASDNFGACNDFLVGSRSASEISRAIMKFNLSSLPVGATITSAKLTMTKTGGNNAIASFGMHRITQAWTEGLGGCGGSTAASNWNQRQTGTSWASAGGSFGAAESTTSVGSDAQYSWDVKNLVMGWQNGSIANNGVLLKMVNEGIDNEKKFASFEEGDATKRPVLSITYLVPPTPGTSQYSWSNGATSSSITVSPMNTTTYTVTVSETGGCTGIKSITVTVNPKPTVDAGVNPSLCKGGTVILTAQGSGGSGPGTYSYNWDNPASSGQTKQVTPMATSIYNVTVTDANGCTNTDAVTVTVNNPPISSASNDGPLSCTKASVTLTANPASGVSYKWSTGATTRTTTVSLAGTYTVTVTDLNTDCTSAASTTVVGDNTVPTVEAGPDVTVNCFNPTKILTAVANAPLLWSTGATTASITVSPESTTKYYVTVTASNGCIAVDSVLVTANKAKPTASLTANGNNCITNNAQLFGSASGGTAPYTYSYTGPNNFTSILQNPTIDSSGTYILTVTDANGCTDTESIVIFSKVVPIVLVITTEICVGETVTLTASGGVSYKWGANANNATTASVMVTPNATTSYTVTVTTADGCTGTGTATITVYQKPVITKLDVVQNSSCNNTGNTGKITVNATGQPGLTLQYRINGGQWQLSNMFNNLGNGVYNVEVSYTTRLCTSDPAQANISSNPGLVVVAENDKSVCPATPFTLSATAALGTAPYTYKWSSGATGNPINIAGIAANTTFTVTVTDSKGCEASDIVNVTLKPGPGADISGPTQVCANDFASFVVNNPTFGETYMWTFDGGVTQDGDADDVTENVKWSDAFKNTFRTVTLKVTKDGCSAYDTAQIFIKQDVFVNTPGDTAVCQGGAVQIGPNPNDPNQVSPGATFLWTPNLYLNNNTVAQPLSSPPFDITYTLTATINGCVETRQVFVDVNVNLNPVADAGPDKTICMGESVQIGGNPTATPPTKPVGATILGLVWTPGGSQLANPFVSPVTNTEYRVVVVSSTGCADTDFVNVTVEPKAKVGDFVWEDINGNGIQDGGEPGINGIQVTLYNALNNIQVATTATGNNPVGGAPGYYQFEVCKGSYYIIFGTKQDYFRTFANLGNDNLDSDANQTTGRTDNFTLNPGDNNQTIDAGYYRLASIGDFVWIDTNEDGIQNVGELGKSNVLVSITGILANGTLIPPSNQLTGLNGQYLFTGLIPGTYTVVVNKPVDFNFSPANQGIDDAKDSDSNPATGVMPAETLESGEVNLTYDAGLYPSINLELDKTFISAVPQANGSFNVTYTIIVKNTGGAGAYDLTDNQGFDADAIINSASYTSNAPGNAGPTGLVGIATWNLATNQAIAALATHTYTLLVNVTLSLTDNIGDNIYQSCDVEVPRSGRGLYNKALVYVSSVLKDEDDACGDIPNVTMRKDFGTATQRANGTFDVTYSVIVGNTGGAPGTYTLKDTPQFDTDVVILSGSYSGQAVGVLGTVIGSSTTLGTNVIIGAGATHVYNLTYNVRLQLEPNSNDPGNNIYTTCAVSGNGPGSGPGQGLYNKAELDRTGDGITDITDDACGDIPNITMIKDFEAVTLLNDGRYNVRYKITVRNTGGASGDYNLKDSPLFDNDVTIEGWDYTFIDVNAGIGNGPSFLGSPPVPINLGTKTLTAGNTHIYTISFTVRLNLAPGSPDGGDNIYTPCEVRGNGPGSSQGHGLYNKAEVDKTGDGITDISDDACEDLPYVTHDKKGPTISVQQANGSYNVSYTVEVRNIGGAVGQYDLKDIPNFDDDIAINSANYTSTNPPNLSGPLSFTNGVSNTLGNDVSIAAGALQVYTLNYNVTLNLSAGSGGNNTYTSCRNNDDNGPSPGQGLYNMTTLDRNNDGQVDETDEVCGDLPYVTHDKKGPTISVQQANGSYNVSYTVEVRNIGGAVGQYDLKDIPNFDDDIAINSANYTSTNPPNLSGPLSFTNGVSNTLGNDVSIAAGALHVYTLNYNVTLNLVAGSGGNNIYTSCRNNDDNGPSPGQGLYNMTTLDTNNDGQVDETDEVCGDLPEIIMVKDFVSVVKSAGENSYYDVKYKITVSNIGGASGNYSLLDEPLFDDDIEIIAGSYTGQAFGNMNILGGSTTLANNVSITAGGIHMYNVTFTVNLNLGPNSGGDNIYNPCEVPGNGPGSSPRQGLYNIAKLDKTGDNIPDIIDDACGDLPKSSIGDFVWEDKNANGIQDIGEVGIPNVLVRLFNGVGTQINSILTGPQGQYLFSNLNPGIYSVGFQNVGGFVRTDPNVGINDAVDSDPVNISISFASTNTFILPPGTNNLTIDAGYYKLARIGDFVWEDTNLNGLQDVLEPGLNNVTVKLTGTDGRGLPVSLNTTTSNTGFYEFNNLVPGTYMVEFVRPSVIYLSTLANVGLDDTKDSDADVVTGKTGMIILNSGDNNMTIDAGFYRCAKVGDYVWREALNTPPNNIQDPGDTGLNGITVQLFSAGNPAVPYETQLTRNGPDGKPGYYLFECMPPGLYFIKVINPKFGEYVFVVPNQVDDFVDSDIIDFGLPLHQMGKTLNFNVNYAETILNIDIGFTASALPVDLTGFDGWWNQNKDVNELAWETASELNSDYFDVQRSFKGSAYRSIGQVKSADNSNSAKSYGLIDNDIKVNGIYSYRLRQVDIDGKETISKVVNVVVERQSERSVSLYPNPATQMVTIELSAQEGSKVSGNIFDNTGRLIMSGVFDEVIQSTNNSYQIDIATLKPGVYTVMVTIDGDTTTHKLIVLK